MSRSFKSDHPLQADLCRAVLYVLITSLYLYQPVLGIVMYGELVG